MGRLDFVKLLLSLGADPYLRDLAYRSAPIGWAYHSQQRDVVAHNADLNVAGKDGKTVLDHPLARGLNDFADVLLRYGARAGAA